MKKQLVIISMLLFALSTYAQGGGFNYKALITQNNNALNNQTVSIKFTVLENGGTSVFQETHTTLTDANGIVSVVIGEGTQLSGAFGNIDWGTNQYYLKVEIDTGSGYQDFGTNELKAVPYAKYAEKAGNVLTETQVDNYVANNGYLTNEIDGSTTNELQTLTFNNTTRQLSITNGNTVTIPAGSASGGDGWGTQVAATDASITGDGTSGNVLGVDTSSTVFNGWDKNASDDFDGQFSSLSNVPAGLSDGDDNTQLSEAQVDNFVANNGYLTNEVDGSTTNELQTISKNASNIVTLSNGGGSFTDSDTHLTDTQIGAMGYIKSANDADNDPTNEIELPATATNGQVLTWNGSDWVAQNAGSGADNWGSQVVTSNASLSGNGTAGSPLAVDTSSSTFNGWDKNASDDFSGNYNDLSNKPIAFYKKGTTNAPTSINDSIYTYGNVGIGVGNPNSALDVYTTGHHGIVSNVDSTDASSKLAGSFEVIGNGNGDHIGVYSSIDNNGNGDHIGSMNDLRGSGTGIQYCVRNYLDNSNDNFQYGVSNMIFGNGDGRHTGVDNSLFGFGDAQLFGVYNYVRNTGSGHHYGVKNDIQGIGSGRHYGMQSILGGTGMGKQYAVYDSITNSGNATHYAKYSVLNGSGSGKHYGNYNILYGSGAGRQVGVYDSISNSGDSNHYGKYSVLNGSGYGDHYGSCVKLYGSGSGEQIAFDSKITNPGNAQHIGLHTVIDGQGIGEHFGVYTVLSGNGSGNHLGSYNFIYGDGSGEQCGANIVILNQGNGVHYGNNIQLEGYGSGKHYGTRATLSGGGTGTHYGSYVELSGAGTGKQIAVYDSISNSGNNYHYAKYSVLNGSGTGGHYGNYVELAGTGSGSQNAFSSNIINSGNGSHIGISSVLTGNGSGEHTGTYNGLGGDGTGIQYASYNLISNTKDADHYGVNNLLMGNGYGKHYGVNNILMGSGIGRQIGTNTVINNSGSGVHTGSNIELGGTGTGRQVGVDNHITNTGNGKHFGVRNIIDGSGTLYGVMNIIDSDNSHSIYGSYNIVSGSESGIKYGTYNVIDASSGGYHFAVYGEATKTGSYAGFFVGNVRISRKLVAPSSGDADLKATYYGSLTDTGTLMTTASTDGYTISHPSTGEYHITFTYPMTDHNHYIVVVTMRNGATGFIGTDKYSAYFKVMTYDTSGTAADRHFDFVVYKK